MDSMILLATHEVPFWKAVFLSELPYSSVAVAIASADLAVVELRSRL